MVLRRKPKPVAKAPTSAAGGVERGRSGRLPERIVSGGQTGVDRAALDFAIRHGVPHGGWCPAGRWAEDGPIGESYALRETPDSDCAQRTEWNVRDSDGTVIFTVAAHLSGGSALTQRLAIRYGKPCLHLARSRDAATAVAHLRDFIRRERIRVLNVAGPRWSVEPAAAEFATEVLEGLWADAESSSAAT